MNDQLLPETDVAGGEPYARECEVRRNLPDQTFVTIAKFATDEDAQAFRAGLIQIRFEDPDAYERVLNELRRRNWDGAGEIASVYGMACEMAMSQSRADDIWAMCELIGTWA